MRGAFAALVAFVLLAGCAAPEAGAPQPGQPGKDVVWLPSSASMVEAMLDLAGVGAGDRFFDLGSGDGRTVLAAARRGANASGIEFDAGLVALSRRSAERERLAGKATFVQGDLFNFDFSDASVVTLFLLTNMNVRLRPKLLALKPGTRIVSSTFRMGGWLPDAQSSTGCGSFCTAYLWIVPAKVEGYWDAPGGELTLIQDFQRVYGTLKHDGASLTLLDGKLRGDEVEFRAGDALYRARYRAGVLEGTVTSGRVAQPWTATRRPL